MGAAAKCRAPTWCEERSHTPARTGENLIAVSADEGHHAPVPLVEETTGHGDLKHLHGPFGQRAGPHHEAVVGLASQGGDGEGRAPFLSLPEEFNVEDLVGLESVDRQLQQALGSQLKERAQYVDERTISEKHSGSQCHARLVTEHVSMLTQLV